MQSQAPDPAAPRPQLPRGWSLTTLSGLLFELRTGPFGSTLHQSDYRLGGTPVVNPASIRDGRIIPITKMAVDEGTLERLSTFSLRAGDIVMARRGDMGRCAVVTPAEEGWLCGTGSLVLRPSPEISALFLALAIGSPPSHRYLTGAAVGATMLNLNQSVLLKLPIWLPPTREQDRIVAKVDELMSLCDRLEASLREGDDLRSRLLDSLLAEALAPVEAAH